MRRRVLFRNRSNVVIAPNTFIGGVASTIPDAQSLAAKLSTANYPLTESDISYFAVVGSDIEATITKNYQIPVSGFAYNTDITSFEDTDAKLALVGGNAFYWATNIRKFHANGNLGIGSYAFRKTTAMDVDISNKTGLESLVFYQAGLSTLDIRNVTTIGSEVGDNNVFELISGNPTIYAHSSLQTINNGGMEGDLVDAQNNGATIVFV